MDITRASIEKNRITVVVLVILFFGGIMAYNSLPKAEDPGFTIRTAVVQTFYPGASPKRVEMLVTDKIEKAVQEIPELDNVTSESRKGFSIVFVNIREKYKDMRPIFDNLRRKVDKVREQLPKDINGPHVNDEFGDVYGIIITISGSSEQEFSYVELKEVADQVRDELLMIGDVAKVEIHGAQEERIFVEYNNARLTELGISPLFLKQTLEARNIIIPGGEIFTQDEQIALEPSGNFESVEDLKRTIISIPNRKALLYLEDIATITRGTIDPPARKMRTSNAPCLGLAVSMRKGGNIVTMGDDVRRKMDYLKTIYPIGIDFDVIAFQPDVVRAKVDDFVVSLVQSIVIVCIVMLLFLGLRTGLIVASLIPMAMLTSILCMQWFSIGINTVSLASLIVALGMLVDNAIVMSEAIMVKMENGISRIEAAVQAAKELQIPLLVSSLTTAAAFLPIFMAKSKVGEYTGALFKVVTITLLCSWFLAITMIPLFCYWFIKVKVKKKSTAPDTPTASAVSTGNLGDAPVSSPADAPQQFDGEQPEESKTYVLYRNLLCWMLNRRGLTVGITTAVFLVSLLGAGIMTKKFFPQSDKPIVRMNLEFPKGTPIAKTEEMIKEVDAFIQKELKVPLKDGKIDPDAEGIINWGTFIGYGGTRFVLNHTPRLASPEYAFILANTTSDNIIDEIKAKTETFCNERFPDLNASVKRLPTGPAGSTPIAVRLKGRSAEKLFAVADKVKAQMESIKGTRNIEDDWGLQTKKLVVDINQARARKAGVTNQDVAISLYTILSGLKVTEFREDDNVIPIQLRTVATDRRDIGKLETIDVYSQQTGRSIPLKQIADIRLQWEPSQVLRRDRLLTVTVSCDLSPEITAGEVNAQLEPRLKELSKNWEPGYGFEMGGEMEESGNANKAIMAQLPFAAFIIFLLIILQFNSFRQTFIVLVTIPLGSIGVILGVLLMKSYFGFMTLLGLISLAGIVINNAIVLLDRIRIEIEEEGRSPQDAVIAAAILRFRPILLTTATTMGGLLPLYFGGGPMWEPMAIAIFFGLGFATTLTLGLVPVLYAMLYKVSYKDYKRA